MNKFSKPMFLVAMASIVIPMVHADENAWMLDDSSPIEVVYVEETSPAPDGLPITVIRDDDDLDEFLEEKNELSRDDATEASEMVGTYTSQDGLVYAFASINSDDGFLSYEVQDAHVENGIIREHVSGNLAVMVDSMNPDMEGAVMSKDEMTGQWTITQPNGYEIRLNKE